MLAAYLNWLREEKGTRPNGDHWVLWIAGRIIEIRKQITGSKKWPRSRK